MFHVKHGKREKMAVGNLVPNTNLNFLNNVDLDNSYSNTFSWQMFGNVTNQATFFLNKSKYKFTEFTPIRLQNAIRVPVVADNLYDCNYIMFQNNNFSGKWFYAFITAIDWINVNMCEVHYEIDIMQTWLWEINLGQCFVEREHIDSDVIGSNLVPENLELGQYISANGIEKSQLFNKWGIMIASIYEASGAIHSGGMYSGIYSGVDYVYCQDAETANNYIQKMNDENKQDGIVAIYMCPTNFFQRDLAVFESGTPKKYDNIDGYVPRNNKLFTYPYNFLYVTNFQGNCAEYHYEWFNDGNCRFEVAGDCTPSMQVIMSPKNYKGVAVNYNESITLSNFPPCTYNIDFYKAWLAQNQTSLTSANLSSAMSALTQVALIGGGAATGNIPMTAAGVIGAASTITGAVGKRQHAKAQPDQAKGATTGVTQFALKNYDFGYMKMQISQEFARIIDGYFTMYGYQTNEVKTPNCTGRQSWNYVKTANANVTGHICFDDLARIKQIFNAGITFWHGDFVGRYERSNNPI